MSNDVTDYGAVGDGESLNSEAYQDALDDCAETAGTVHVDAVATVEVVGDFREFPTVESRWESWNQYRFDPCL